MNGLLALCPRRLNHNDKSSEEIRCGPSNRSMMIFPLKMAKMRIVAGLGQELCLARTSKVALAVIQWRVFPSRWAIFASTLLAIEAPLGSRLNRCFPSMNLNHTIAEAWVL